MHVVFAIVLIGVTLAIFARTVSRARAAASLAVPVKRGGKMRAAPGAKKMRGKNAPIVVQRGTGWLASRVRMSEFRHKVRLTNWLETERHQRKLAERAASAGKSAPAAVPPSAVPAGGGGAAQQQASASAGAPSRTPAPAARPSQAQDHPPASPAQGQAVTPAGRSAPAPAPQPTTGGTVMSAGHVEQVIEGINGIHASAMAGNIHAKRKAIQSLAEVQARVSATAIMLSRAMAEPGSNYGPEITEPIAAAATHMQASAMSLGESDGAVTTLILMQVGELAQSPRQAPHNSELSEGGAPSGGRGGYARTAPPNTFVETSARS